MKRKFESLSDLVLVDRGLIDALFKDGMKRAYLDLSDRPHVKGARSVSLTVSMTPVEGTLAGILDEVHVEFDVKVKTPVVRTKTYSMCPRNGHMTFNAESPDNHRQHTLDEVPEQKKGQAHARRDDR